MFYTFVKKFGNRIFHRYVDDDGKRQIEVVKEFPIDLFVRTDNPDLDHYLSLYNDVLQRVEFETIESAMDFEKSYGEQLEIFGQTDLEAQFISHHYPGEIEFDISKIRILNIDIETAFDETGFPDPMVAHQPVLSISFKMMGADNPMLTYAIAPSSKADADNCIVYPDEKSMLSAFLVWWQQNYPDVITGWNTDMFDIPFLVNRMKNLLGEKQTEKLSPFHNSFRHVSPFTFKEINGKMSGHTCEIMGITNYDYMELYKKYNYARLENFRLDTVALFELGEGKVGYGEYRNLMELYRGDFNKFIKYNRRDVDIIDRFDQKLNYMFLSFTVAYLGKVRPCDIWGQVKFWDVFIYNKLRDRGVIIPPQKISAAESIVGAYVKDPTPSLYKWIVTVDLTSLYPSIIMSFNMGPETHRGRATHTIDDIDDFIDMRVDTSAAHEQGYSIIANGAMFDNATKGIFCELTEDVFADRKRNKKAAIECAKQAEVCEDPEERRAIKMREATFDAKQMALKIALNSLYGASANRFFRYRNRDIAEGITMTGQLIIRFISKRLNEELNRLFKTKDVDYVIFNDTDSAGLNLQYLVDKMFPDDQSDTQKIVDFLDKFEKTYVDPFMEECFAELTTWLNCYQNKISMKREVIADKGLWRGKKHYILQKLDQEGVRYKVPKLKMMGIETAKSSTPNIVRGSLEKAIDIILNGTEEQLQAYVTEFKDEFFNAPVSAIAFPRGVSDIEKWKVRANEKLNDCFTDGNIVTTAHYKKGSPIHVRAALIYNAMLIACNISSELPEIHNGDKIKYAYLIPQNPTKSNVIGFLDELPPEFEMERYVDRELQFTKTFLDPLKSFTDIVGWSTEDVYTLDDFFG